MTFKKDGSSLITGWNDGKIRAFGPQSGRLQYEIHDAHKKCVTALAVTDPYNNEGDFKIVSGGEGMIYFCLSFVYVLFYRWSSKNLENF